MLRIPFLAFLVTYFSLTAAQEVLGQRSLITARAVLPGRALFERQNDFTCAQATDTVCPDGSGCCPGGAACFSSGGVGLCSVTCEAAQPTCVFNGVTACCPVGDTCGGSLCIPATGLVSATSSSQPPATTSAAVLSSSSESSSESSSASSSSESSSAVSDGFIIGNGTSYSNPGVVSISVSGDGGVATSVTTSTSTARGTSGNTNTFALSPTTTTSGPLQQTGAAAPTLGAWKPILNMAALAALGLAI